MRENVYKFCQTKMQLDPDSFIDSSQCFNFTGMAEAFLSENGLDPEKNEVVFELVVDWFNQWPERVYFNQ